MKTKERIKLHVRSGDEVVVISGSASGRRGRVKEVFAKKLAVVLEGIDEQSKQNNEKQCLIKPVLHHLKKSQQNPQGGLLWLEGAIHVSNVMKIGEFERRNANRSQ